MHSSLVSPPKTPRDVASILLATTEASQARVFAPDDLRDLAGFGAPLERVPATELTAEALRPWLSETEVLITSWGTPFLTDDLLAEASRLRLIAHAAGTVKPVISRSAWERGIRVTTASDALAFGVAEYTLALIVSAAKRVPWLSAEIRHGGWRESLGFFGPPFELYRQRIGIIGCGRTGRNLIRLLQPYDCQIVVWDPYLTRDEARSLNVECAESLDALFASCKVVSLHAPLNSETVGMLGRRHFDLLGHGAVFINTSRFNLISEGEFIESARRGHFVACLDVLPVEPLPPLHPLRTIPNVVITPHIAGAMANNGLRLGRYIVQEVARFLNGKRLHGEVTYDTLNRIGDN